MDLTSNQREGSHLAPMVASYLLINHTKHILFGFKIYSMGLITLPAPQSSNIQAYLSDNI